MKIRWHTPYGKPGFPGRGPEPDWPEDWPPPSLGDEVAVPGTFYEVRSVSWYPNGEDDSPEPFVYVVLR